MQNHESETNQEFITRKEKEEATWKEKEEATSNTHYILHHQPYVMSSSENDGISGKLFYYVQIFSSIIAIRCSTGTLLLCMLQRWKLQSIQLATQNSEKNGHIKSQAENWGKHASLECMLLSLARVKWKSSPIPITTQMKMKLDLYHCQ